MKYTTNMGLRKPEGGEYYSIDDFNVNVDTLDAAVSVKANKPFTFIPGNLAAIGVGGNLEDSGKKEIDFAAADHNHNAMFAPIEHIKDTSAHVSEEEKAAIATVDDKASVFEPLQWFDLPMRNFYKGDSFPIQYAKDQFDVVHLRGVVYDQINNANSGVSANIPFADLPSDFCPSTEIFLPVTIAISVPDGLICDVVTLQIMPSGIMRWLSNRTMSGKEIGAIMLHETHFSLRNTQYK